MLDDDFGSITNNTGEYARVENLAGHLLLVFPLGYIEHSPTRFSQPGKPSDVIVCDVIDLDGADEAGNPGKIYRTTWWRPSKIIVDLRPFIGGKVLGRIGKGVANNGMNAPWVISDARQEPGAMDRVRAWIQNSPHFTKSTFTPPAPVQQGGFGGAPNQFRQQPMYQGASPQQQYDPAPGYPSNSYQDQGYQQPQQPVPPYQQPAPGYPPAQGYQSPPPAPGYQQPPQPPAPQYQQPPPAPMQQQYPAQQGYPSQGMAPPLPPAYPVQGGPPVQDAGMLAQMRAERAERERRETGQGQYTDEPPF